MITNKLGNKFISNANISLVENDMNMHEIIKTFDSKLCPDIQLKQRFVNEFRVLKMLNHHRLPNVQTLVYRSGQMSMRYPYIHGCSLRQFMSKERINFNQAAPIIIQLLEILEYLHSDGIGIIHSDIHPDNLIYSVTRELHLIDFGCAHRTTLSKPMAATWIGCHAYLSPEQAKGKYWSFYSDLYQVGLIMYELLSGERFNQGVTSRQQIPFAANPVSKRRYQFDKVIDDYLDSLLATDITNRYQNATLARQQLVSLMESYQS